MNTRETFTAVLLGLGAILAFLPDVSNRLNEKPGRLALSLSEGKTAYTVDQVARFIVSNDSTLRLIDLRSPLEFRQSSLPGAINIPYVEFLKNSNTDLSGPEMMKNIIYSNGDIDANAALVIARGRKIRNVFVMQGGMNEWFRTVMNSTFTGDRISVRENALFETRTRAGKLFNEINSLPDSLKQKLLASKKTDRKKLDGGCE